MGLPENLENQLERTPSLWRRESGEKTRRLLSCRENAVWYTVCGSLLAVAGAAHRRRQVPLSRVRRDLWSVMEEQEGCAILAWEGTLVGGPSPRRRARPASASQPEPLLPLRAEGRGLETCRRAQGLTLPPREGSVP